MSITGAFGVPEDDDNGRRLVDFYFEKELCVEWVTYFEHKSLRKCTRVARGQGGTEVKRMITWCW